MSEKEFIRARASVVIAFAFCASLIFAASAQRKPRVVIVPRESERRVDVLIDGQPFTSYIWPATLRKPVLYPLRTASGTLVTRGFPLDPRPGERVDHPHHVGLWFNYGDVNGVDFWNNSSALPPEEQRRMGSIVHRRIVRAENGVGRGELEVEMDWIMPDGAPILRERTTFVFYAEPRLRTVERRTTLTALDRRVLFRDNKEGLLGIRVARQLEQPSNEPATFTDASGRATTVPAMNNAGVTGLYRSSEGLAGDAVWGTRARWTMLSGKIGNEEVTLAILDHPKNVGHPTYWHARGYGLFAANPLGQGVFSRGREKLNFALEPGQSVTFRHRVLIFSGPVSPQQVEEQYGKFVSETK